MMNATSNGLKNLTVSAVCLALCMVLPLLTGQIPQIGSVLSPMHIPVLLCGLLCGPYYAAAIGLIAPLFRFAIFSAPPFFPVLMPSGVVVCGAAMCLELAAYGITAGVIFKLLPKKPVFIYISLITAMLLGRIVWGTAMALILGVADLPFSWEAFVAGAFINAMPGIIVHIILIPVIVMALRRTTLVTVQP